MTIEVSIATNKREITSGTKEWADYNVNCIKGCYNNCRYCYAKVMAKRFGRCTEDTWKDMEVNSLVTNKRFRKYDGRVMFPSSHDIIDLPGIKDACLLILEKLLEVGNEVLVTTKPQLSITETITERFFAYKDQLQFRFTITSTNNDRLLFWEPNAPTFEERFSSLRHAYRKGFKTSVSAEPFLDYDPLPLIESLMPYISESLWLGPMNYIRDNGICESDRYQYEDIRKVYTTQHLVEIYNSVKQFTKIRFKDSMKHRIGNSLEYTV